MKKINFVLGMFMIAYLAGCTNRLEMKKITIKKADGEVVFINAEIAKTEEDRNRGYMFREKIPDGDGMLFVFEKDEILSFWMKNTPHPLSIAFISSDGIIKDIFDMRPMSLANTTSTTYVRYALEVPQGYFDRVGVQVEDVVEMEF